MEIRPYQEGDADRLDLQDIDRWASGEDMRPWEGSAFTIVDGAGHPIGISGFSLEGRVGTGWLMGSQQLRNHAVFLHRTMKRVLHELVLNPGVSCIHVTVENRDIDAARWLERLGFIIIAKSSTISKYMICEDDPRWH